jgi:predicted DNA-binding transcriptional regulator AlpA
MTQNSKPTTLEVPGASGHYERPFSPSDLLNEKEVAAKLGIATGTARNWRSLRIGPLYVKLGKRAVRYRHADVEAFITNGMAQMEVAA